jgi:soluble lytic murein transglycosylase-like protein
MRTAALLLLSLIVAELLWGRKVVKPAQFPYPQPIAHIPSVEERLVEQATQQGLPAQIALNVAWEESRFKERIVSSTHDYGVMQLNVGFFPSAPQMTTEQNIKAGVGLLAKYWGQSHSEALTTRAYRHGPSVLIGRVSTPVSSPARR